MAKIKLAPGAEFPAAELATEVTAAVGIRGSGKSNALAVIAEGLLDQGIQVVVLDPVGLWFSLRLATDGVRPSGLQPYVFGGRHADLHLPPTAGRVVATALATTRAPAVLDVSGMSKADRCRFAADFAEQFLRDKKEHQGPTWLVLEEAQTFAPQVIRHGLEYMGRMLGAFEEMAEVGRNFGLGLGLATQRPQKVNKEVLNLAENVLAFRLLGALERRAIRDWVQENDAPGRAEVDGMLPRLVKGEAIVWSPVRGVYVQAGTPKKRTYDAGATPLAAREKVEVGKLDLGALSAAMAAVVADADANDVRKLRARIADLERQLATRPAPAPAMDTLGVLIDLGEIQDDADELAQAAETLSNALPLIRRQKTRLDALRGSILALDAPTPRTPRAPAPVEKARPGANGAATGASGAEPADRRLSPAALAMLQAAVRTRLPGLTWRQMAVMAGRKASGGAFERDKRALTRDPALLEPINGGDVWRPTAAGEAVSGVDRQAGEATPAELLAMWERVLPGSAGRALRVLVELGPKSDGALRSLVGLDPEVRASGSWERTKRALRDNGLITSRDGVHYPIPELRP